MTKKYNSELKKRCINKHRLVVESTPLVRFPIESKTVNIYTMMTQIIEIAVEMGLY